MLMPILSSAGFAAAAAVAPFAIHPLPAGAALSFALATLALTMAALALDTPARKHPS